MAVCERRPEMKRMSKLLADHSEMSFVLDQNLFKTQSNKVRGSTFPF